MSNTFRTAFVALCSALAACTASDQRAVDTDTGAGTATSATSDTAMKGMGSMAGMMSASTMDSMHVHMQMMDTSSAQHVAAMLSTHRQMAANMLSRMNADMRGMNMSGDAAWNATVDSLRQDLTRMPDLDAAALKSMMPAHHARMMRLMQMHRDMMGKMK